VKSDFLVIILQAFLVRIEALPSYRPESRVLSKFTGSASITSRLGQNSVSGHNSALGDDERAFVVI
jgi:hypothetical protein